MSQYFGGGGRGTKSINNFIDILNAEAKIFKHALLVKPRAFEFFWAGRALSNYYEKLLLFKICFRNWFIYLVYYWASKQQYLSLIKQNPHLILSRSGFRNLI